MSCQTSKNVQICLFLCSMSFLSGIYFGTQVTLDRFQDEKAHNAKILENCVQVMTGTIPKHLDFSKKKKKKKDVKIAKN